MQTLCYVLVLLLAGFFEGSTWKNSVADEQKLLQNIFGGIMEDNFPLKDIYFTLLPDGVPKNSTLYRFNLTYGKIVNIGKLLTPKKETCRLDLTDNAVNAACEFNLKNAEVHYDGAMSYGRDVQERFSLYAFITEFPFGDHINPASLKIIVLFKPGGSVDIRQCLITNFLLSTVTFPPFWKFNYPPFKKNENLAVAVWNEFEVKMFTHVRLTVMNATKDTCIEELNKKTISTNT
nr:uncharacterized protein LOC126528286 isoform X2 [Dermacentor andersoni]XP_054925224.1 uncharacterized protein LOC126528286 isoform X2 [Dermacentor andersoni]